MNWTKIRDDYPKAFNEFAEFYILGIGYTKNKNGSFSNHRDKECSLNNLFGVGDLDRQDIRDLYDFFDSKGIIVAIEIDADGLEQGFSPFTVDIYVNKKDTNSLDFEYYKTRAKAEKYAFTKAFEILEKQLRV